MTFCSNNENVSPNLSMLLVFLYANSRFAVLGCNVSTANYEGRLYSKIILKTQKYFELNFNVRI